MIMIYFIIIFLLLHYYFLHNVFFIITCYHIILHNYTGTFKIMMIM